MIDNQQNASKAIQNILKTNKHSFMHIPNYGILFLDDFKYSNGKKEQKEIMMNPSLNIRMDWSIPFHNYEIIETDDSLYHTRFIQTNEKISFFPEYQNYINDYLTIFHSQIHAGNQDFLFRTINLSKDTDGNSQKLEGLQKQCKKLFPIELFGVSFLSHAHADHSPISFALPKIRIQMPKKKEYLHPFSVLCTKTTQDLIGMRFNMGLIPAEYEFKLTKSSEFSLVQKYLKDIRNKMNEIHPSSNVKIEANQFCSNCYPESYIQEFFQPFQWKNGISWLIPSGHIIGSAGLCYLSQEKISHLSEIKDKVLSHLKNSIHHSISHDEMIIADLVYLGEFNPIFRPHLLPPSPIICDTLIIDTLFADPTLNFPDQKVEIQKLMDWIMCNIKKNPIILFARELGKPQLILSLIAQIINNKSNQISRYNSISEIPIIGSASLQRLNQYLQKRGWMLPPIISRRDARKQKLMKEKLFILIASPTDRHTAAIQKLIDQEHALVAEITGWCMDEKYREEHPSDAFFTISDHVVYEDLLEYLRKCIFNTLIIEGGNELLVATSLQADGIMNIRVL